MDTDKNKPYSRMKQKVKPETEGDFPKKRMNRKLYKLLLFICICIFLISSSLLVKRLYGYYMDNRAYEKIRQQRDITVMATPSADDELQASEPYQTEEIKVMPETQHEDIKPQEPELPYWRMSGDSNAINEEGIFVKYADLKKQNDHMVGWINMPGFEKPIDYPVMQSDDNDFYLNRNFDTKKSTAGSIFMDFRNDFSQVDRHIILYGHAMLDKSMFGNLKEFPLRPDDHKQYTTIYLDAMDTHLEYEVFATYFIEADYNYRQTHFDSDSAYLDFLLRIQSNSVHDYGIELTPLDKIITLSTCNNNLEGDMRSVTHARLIGQTNYYY